MEPPAIAAGRTGRVVTTRSLITALQAAADAARLHPWYVIADKLPPPTTAAVAGKFRARWPDLDGSKDAAYRRRLAELPDRRMVVYCPADPAQTGFVLVMSTGDTSTEDRESWQNVLGASTRLSVRGWWEMVRHARRGSPAPAWTWRMLPERRRAISAEVRTAVGKHWDAWVAQFIDGSRRWPGFAGIRADHRAIGRELLGHWARTHREPSPAWPRLPYVTRKARRKTT